jgi:glycosyltransferase involved in cell wall biosynthesis
MPIDERIRIALCITSLAEGGAERCLTQLALGLDEQQFVPCVFSLGPRPTKPSSRLVEGLEAAGIEVEFFAGRGSLSAWQVTGQLRDRLRAWRPDLVQTFLWHANVLGTLAAQAAGVPHIVTGLRVAEPGRPWRRPLERWASRRAERHVAVSRGVADFARERIGLAAEKIVVIPNGIDVQQYAAPPADLRPLGVLPSRRALLFVGRLEEQKGVAELVDHAPQLFARLPQHDLLLVGQGPLAATIRRRIDQLQLSERVHLVGWRVDVPNLLAAADALLVPSRWEGMSNVVLEALASRLPVVAFDVAGIAELFDPRQVVPRENWREFSERVAKVVGNQTHRSELADAGRALVEREFSLDQMIARYERLYLELTTH